MSQALTPQALLDAGLLRLALPLDDRARQRLLDYLGLMARWNRVINLTAVRDPAAMVTQHLLDSLAILPPLRRWLAGGHQESAGLPEVRPRPLAGPDRASPGPGGQDDEHARPRVLDVGSGAGLPGAVLAVAEPGWSVSCVDAVAKKANFLRQVAAELGLHNLHALHARVEDLPPEPAYDLLTSRAFSSLADFAKLTDRLLAASGCWVAMKGRVPDDEIAALPPGVEVFHVEQLTVPGLEAQRCLVWMRKALP